MNYTDSIQKYLDLEFSVMKKLDISSINKLMNILDDARKRNANIYIMGNGGSASTASHFVNDFNKGVSEYLDIPFRFICLNDNIATLMAIANDISYDAVFEFQLRGKVNNDDVVIGISGSGNSSNVLNAIAYAKDCGALTVSLTGFDGGELAKMVDISLHVPVMNMQITEDIHMIFNHVMMAVFYKELCGKEFIKEENP